MAHESPTGDLPVGSVNSHRGDALRKRRRSRPRYRDHACTFAKTARVGSSRPAQPTSCEGSRTLASSSAMMRRP